MPNAETNKSEYLVHYNGWSKKWDERVPVDRLMKDNEEGRKLRSGHIQEEKKKAREAKRKEGVSFSSNYLLTTFVGTSEARVMNRESRKSLPESLQLHLVNDWIVRMNSESNAQSIECQSKLYSLPYAPSVQQILEDVCPCLFHHR